MTTDAQGPLEVMRVQEAGGVLGPGHGRQSLLSAAELGASFWTVIGVGSGAFPTRLL